MTWTLSLPLLLLLNGKQTQNIYDRVNLLSDKVRFSHVRLGHVRLGHLLKW